MNTSHSNQQITVVRNTYGDLAVTPQPHPGDHFLLTLGADGVGHATHIDPREVDQVATLLVEPIHAIADGAEIQMSVGARIVHLVRVGKRFGVKVSGDEFSRIAYDRFETAVTALVAEVAEWTTSPAVAA